MTRRSLLAVCLVAFALSAAGCGPPWTVVVQAVPDPFAGVGRFVVTPVDFTGLHVGKKSEAEYLSEKDEKQQKSFAGDKAGINEAFTEGLMERAAAQGFRVDPATGPQDGPFVIRPYVRFIEPGFYAFVAAEPSQVEMDVKITTPDGRILDEIAVTHRTQGSLSEMAESGNRLRADGRVIGLIVARYVGSRVGVP